MLLTKFFRKFLQVGTLHLIDPNGQRETTTATPSPEVTVRINNRRIIPKLLLVPNFYFAESYVRGDLEILQGDLRDLLTILMRSIPESAAPTVFDRLRRSVSPLVDAVLRVGNPLKARHDVQFHYDLSNEFFKSFLDRNMQYSCAYFRSDKDSIDQAQLQKMRHISAKLLLKPGQKVLDIGSGWGGLARFISSQYDVDVTGVTLSENQHQLSNAVNGGDRTRFELRDYRHETGSYDRIVSVGMLEHVGRGNYGEYFSQVARLLKDDGIAMIHSIGRRGVPEPINIWIRRRIFPGAYLPSLSQLASAVERSGLWLLDCEVLRMHYAETLRCWHEAVQARRAQIVAERGEQFYRAWEFYLISCELGFRYQGLEVFQLVLGKQPTAAPLTRDFIYEEEARLARSQDTPDHRAA